MPMWCLVEPLGWFQKNALKVIGNITDSSNRNIPIYKEIRSYDYYSPVLYETCLGSSNHDPPNYHHQHYPHQKQGLNKALLRDDLFEGHDSNKMISVSNQQLPPSSYASTQKRTRTNSAIVFKRTKTFGASTEHTGVWVCFRKIHPGRLTWNLKLHPWKKKIVTCRLLF